MMKSEKMTENLEKFVNIAMKLQTANNYVFEFKAGIITYQELEMKLEAVLTLMKKVLE